MFILTQEPSALVLSFKRKQNSLFELIVVDFFNFSLILGSEYMDSVEPNRNLMQTDGPPDCYGNDISLPTEADFLYAYSTVPGYYSWRNSVTGSW